MRKSKTNTVIMSAFVSSLTTLENVKRNADLKNDLESLGFNFKEVVGCYKGQFETSLVIPILCDSVETLKGLLMHYNQDCIMVIDVNNLSYLHYPNNTWELVGTFREVTKEVAESREAYTFDNGQYYITL